MPELSPAQQGHGTGADSLLQTCLALRCKVIAFLEINDIEDKELRTLQGHIRVAMEVIGEALHRYGYVLRLSRELLSEARRGHCNSARGVALYWGSNALTFEHTHQTEAYIIVVQWREGLPSASHSYPRMLA